MIDNYLVLYQIEILVDKHSRITPLLWMATLDAFIHSNCLLYTLNLYILLDKFICGVSYYQR